MGEKRGALFSFAVSVHPLSAALRDARISAQAVNPEVGPSTFWLPVQRL